jgi:hypothetical protein
MYQYVHKLNESSFLWDQAWVEAMEELLWKIEGIISGTHSTPQQLRLQFYTSKCIQCAVSDLGMKNMIGCMARLRWAGYSSEYGDRWTTTRSGGLSPGRCCPERTLMPSGHLICVVPKQMGRLGFGNAGKAWQLVEARCSLLEFCRRLLPCCCSAAAAPGGSPPLGPRTGGRGAASAAQSRGRDSRLWLPGRHARAGSIRSRWGVLVCIYILTVCYIYPMFIRHCALVGGRSDS